MIFGASKMGELAYQALKWNEEVIHFCDNDKKKWGTYFCDLLVLSPGELKELFNCDVHDIVIASMYHANIAAQMVRMGIPEFKVFKYDFEQVDQHMRNYQKGLIDFINRKYKEDGFGKVARDAQREFTAIIPTKNRPEEVQKCIEYYCRMNGPDIRVFLVVLDGSREDVGRRTKSFIDTIKGHNIVYKAFDSDINPMKKGFMGLNFVKTEYCAWCADDDYYLKEGIIKSIDFLDKHQDFIGTKGRVSFFVNGDLDRIYEIDRFPISGDIDEDSAIGRMRSFFKSDKYCNLAYVIFRKKMMTMLGQVILRHEDIYLGSNYGLVEYLNDIMIAGSGKIKDIKCDLSLRDMSPNSLSFIGETLKDAVYDGNFNEIFFKMSVVLKEFASTFFNENLDMKQALRIFSEFLVNYCNIGRRYVKYASSGFDLPLLTKGFEQNEYWRKVRRN